MTNKKIKHIAIILKPSDIDELPNLITNLCRWLSKRSKKIYLLEKEKSRLKNKISDSAFKLLNFENEQFIYNKPDLLISLGGDGTLLGVSRRIKSTLPVFSVNLGRLGFITEFGKNEFYEKLNVILLGKYDVIKKNLYTIEIFRNEKRVEKKLFFNDAVFTKNDIARMFTLSLEANNEHIYNISGDGLIISSTYGSTAYSLAAGGPIVHPDVKALILTPICAHSLTHRPLVIPDNQTLTIKIIDKIDSGHITLDGQISLSLHYKDVAKVQRQTRHRITLIKNEEKTYFHTLKEKFVHGRREVY